MSLIDRAFGTNKNLLPSAFLTAIIFFHLILVMLKGADSLIFDSLFSWFASVLLLKRQCLAVGRHGEAVSFILGFVLLSQILIGCLLWGQEELFLRTYPLGIATSVTLLFFGVSGIRKTWKVLVLLLIFLPTRDLLAQMLDLTVPTARFVASLLSFFGKYPIPSESGQLVIQDNIIRIIPECASVGTMRRMLAMATWFVLWIPVTSMVLFTVPILTMAYAFIANGLRVSLLVVLKANGHKQAFDFWHEGAGANLLPLVVLIPLFMVFHQIHRHYCWKQLRSIP
jgi:exosortase/archaeosortase family protein